MTDHLEGTVLVDGEATGAAAVIAPLSFWGGVDQYSGVVTDRFHDAFDMALSGRIVVMSHGAGSSSSSAALAELIRREVGPVGIVLEQRDAIVVVGVAVANDLYGRRCPVVLAPTATSSIPDGATVSIAGGSVTIEASPVRGEPRIL